MATISPLGSSSTAVESAVTTPSVPPNTAQIRIPSVNPSTTWRPGQQKCFNYTVNRPCHVGPRCSYYHDEVARQAWLNSSTGKRAMARRALETPSLASEPTGASYITVEKSPQVQPVFTKLDTQKPPTSQPADTSTPLQKSSSSTTSSIGDGVRPSRRHKSVNSSSSSIKSELDKMSFDEWNKNVATARTDAAREVINIEASAEVTPVTVGKSTKNDENTKSEVDSGVEHPPAADTDKINISSDGNLIITENQATSNTSHNIPLQEHTLSTTSNIVRTTSPTLSHLKPSRFSKFQDIRLEEQESGAKITKVGTTTKIEFPDMKPSETAVGLPNITSLSPNNSNFTPIIAADPAPYVKRSRFFNNQDVRLEDPSFVKSMRGDVALDIAPAEEKLEVVHETQDISIEKQKSLDGSKVDLTIPNISEIILGSEIVEEAYVEEPPAVNTLTPSLPTSTLASIPENSVAENSVEENSVIKNSVPEDSVPEDSVVENSVAENPDIFHKTEDICLEQQSPLKHTEVARSGSTASTSTGSSISSTSTGSSAALRKSYDITHKVMTFLHRRVNSVSAPAPLGEGHPAYDGDSAHPRVNLPNSGHRRVDSNSAPPPLDHNHPAFDNISTPRVSLPCALAEAAVMPPVVQETKTPEKPNSHTMVGLNAWKNAALIIEATDKSQQKPKAAADAAAVLPATPTKFVTKFKFRLIVESPYGKITSSDTGTQYPVTMAPVVPDIDLGAQPAEEPAAESVDELCAKTDKISILKLASEPAFTVIQKSSDAPTNSESNNDDTSTAVVAKKADTCINFVRGRPCKHGRRCPYFHDIALRDTMMRNPSEALLNGIKRSNKGTTSNHSSVLFSPQSEKKEIIEIPEIKVPNISEMAETAVVAKCNDDSQQAPRCNRFILGYNCHHKENEYYHDTALRSAFHQAIRDNPDICKNFLLGRDCASPNCKYRHDVVVRDSLNKIHSGPSMQPISNSCSFTAAASDYAKFAPVAKPGKKNVAVGDTAHHQITGKTFKKPLPCKSFVLGYECIRLNCSYEHDSGLRSALLKMKRDVCKNYLLDTPCVSRGSCQLRHDAELHDSLMAGYASSVTGSSFTRKAEKAMTPNNSPKRARSPGSRSVSPENVALAAGWRNFTANVAAHDAAEEAAYVALRSASAASSQGPYTLNTIYKHRVQKSTCSSKSGDAIIQPTVEPGNSVVDIKSSENLDVNVPTAEVPSPKVLGETAGSNVSSTMENEPKFGVTPEPMTPAIHHGDGAGAESGREAMTAGLQHGDGAGAEPGKEAMPAAIHNSDGGGAESGKETLVPANSNLAASRVMGGRLCPWFHDNRYECKKGDSCRYRHDHKLQQSYKSKDPRFKVAFPAAKNCGEPSKWAKKTDEAVWSSRAVPMALPPKGKGKFMYFPLLPGEIRLKIWEYVLLTPYSPIVLQFFQNEHSYRPTAKYVNITRTPVALRTCHESRVEALKFYELCLSSPGSPARTFLDYRTSYVYLCTRRSGYFRPMMKGLAPRDLEQIRHLTLKLRDWFCNDDTEFRDAIWRFKRLRTLQLLVSALKEDEDMRSPEAVSRVRECLKWQVEELNPGWRAPRVVVAVVKGLEGDSDPEEYKGPSTRGERIMELRYQVELSQMFSSAT